MDYANVLVGTAPLDDPRLIGNAPPPGEELYTGMTSPGAVLPHGLTNLSPVNKNLDLSYPAGVGISYNYLHRTMLGFTAPMQGMVLMPVVGDWTVPPERSASVYDKAREKASPGYYTVYLDDYRVKVEMTVTASTGIYRFTFPKTARAHIVLDLGRAGGTVEVAGGRTVRGYAERPMRGRVSGTSLRGTARSYFIAEFSKPFATFGTFRQNPPSGGRGSAIGGNTVDPGMRNVYGTYAGAFLDFATAEGEQVLVKVASGESQEAAQKYFETENSAWDFDGIRKRAEAIWAEKLDRIQVKGGTEKQRMLFYSTLFHSLASPPPRCKRKPFPAGFLRLTTSWF